MRSVSSAVSRVRAAIARQRKTTGAAIAIVLLAGPVASGQAGTQVGKPDAHGFIRVPADDLAWRGGATTESIVLVGDPNKPGIYVLRNRFPPGQMSRPHFHNQDRFVTVIKGTWWTATGPDADVFDPSKTVPLKAGGFLMHPAGAHHYDGARDEEVIVQIIGMGPVTTTAVGGGPADADDGVVRASPAPVVHR